MGSNTDLHTAVNELKAAVAQLQRDHQVRDSPVFPFVDRGVAHGASCTNNKAINDEGDAGEENNPEVARLRSEHAELLAQIQQADSRWAVKWIRALLRS